MINANLYALILVLTCAVRSATAYGADIDVSAYCGMAKGVLSAGAQGSGITLDAKLQTSNIADGSYFTTDGDADLPLNKSTSGKTTLGVKWTQSGARQIKRVFLKLKKTGTIASDKVLTLNIMGNSSTVPDGSSIGTSGTVLANGIGTSYEWVEFVFATPVNVADSTTYWFALSSNYTASDSNFISWSVFTVTSGGTAATEASATWTAVTTQKPMFQTRVYNFTDITNAAFTQVGNAAASAEVAVDIDNVKNFVRAVLTVAGGSATGSSVINLFAMKQRNP